MTTTTPPGDDPDESPNLPIPAESTRSYLLVRPTDDSLGPSTVQRRFRRLHQLGDGPGQSFLDVLLRRSNGPPTIECLLASTGGDDDALTYAFGIDDDEVLDELERSLRQLFPTTYEIERVDWLPSYLGRLRRDAADEALAAVEFTGNTERRADWQTRLTSFEAFHEDDQGQVPLATVAETMAERSVPMVYQALLRPMPDWSRRAEDRRIAIEANQDTLRGQISNVVFGPPDDDDWKLPQSAEDRLEELEERDARHSFAVNVRAVAVGTDGGRGAERAARELASAFADVSYSCYRIEGAVATGSNAASVFETVRERAFTEPNYERLATVLPFTANTSAGIVADATEAPSFCVLSGGALTAAGARAVAPTPGERTSLPRPPFDLLANYRGDGLLLGTPLTQDGTPDDEPIVLPPDLQPLHVGWFGKTGSGKSTALVNAILANHAASDGAEILIDPKGDGMATDYLRAHYAEYGTLDDVLYFDCADVLPAFAFLDVRNELEAGVLRTTAVEDLVDHYVAILKAIIGRERFEQAVRSPDVIRYLLKALFDPVHGHDAISHRDLHGAARRMHERQSAPAVSDPDLERMLGGVVANRAQTFDEIMQGVANRIEKVPVDERLATIFNHVPDEDDPRFDLAKYLDEDVVIVFDTGRLRSEAQRVLALLIFSNLWTALRRRKQRSNGDNPLVNVYVEEAASVAVSDILKELLSQSRGFDCSITLAMQFPGQLGGADEDVYDEVLNNISTVVTGNVPDDRRLARRLATDDMAPEAVANRLRALKRGEWLVGLPAAFDEPEPRPFLAQSVAPPPGDSDGPRPLTSREARHFDRHLERLRNRTREEVGLTLAEPSTTDEEDMEDEEGDQEEPEVPETRVDSALPHTKRMPLTVEYDGAIHGLRCTECDNRYDASIAGMERAIECCSSLAATDRDDVPICDLNLKLTPEERADAAWSDAQLMFLQAVYNAQQLRYDPLEYDLLYDSMLRLQEYIGIDSDAVQDRSDADLLRHDTDHPHRLYTVTPDGRDVIGESYREGVDYGHGAGDLEESSEHVFAVEVARQYLEAEYVADPASAVERVIPYYDLDDQHRLDVAGLDADGEIVVAVEAERVNNDVHRAVPEDFDKIASCDVEEAIWVVMTQSDGHQVLSVLNNPPEGESRVEKTYAKSTPPQQFRIDTPGMTAMYPVETLRDRLDES